MLTLQSGLELLVAAAGGLYAIAQIKTTAEANKNGLLSLKQDLTNLIERNNEITRDLLEAFKVHQTEMMSKEISHMKDLMAVNATETRESIKRLEMRQNESNNLKSRIVMVEASLKSLHKRMNEDITLPIGENLE